MGGQGAEVRSCTVDTAVTARISKKRYGAPWVLAWPGGVLSGTITGVRGWQHPLGWGWVGSVYLWSGGVSCKPYVIRESYQITLAN